MIEKCLLGVKLGDKFIFLQKVLLNHRTCSGKIAPAERILSFIPRTYVNKQFQTGQPMVFKNKHLKTTDAVKYVIQAGANTAWINNDSKTWLCLLYTSPSPRD